MSAYREQTLQFDCEGESLLGVLALPGQDAPLSPTAVLIVVGGPQYRAGSHRQFVLLARALAAGGHAVLRFDCRGMGDGSGALRDFLSFGPDIEAAIQALLAAQPGLRDVVLCGLCDGASAALLYLQASPDPRVRGLCLLNPWVRSAATLAATHVKHYYWRRLSEPAFWRKLLSGRVGAQALSGLWRNLRLAGQAGRPASSQSYQSRMAAGLRQFPGPVLLLISGDDYTAKEFIDLSASAADWQGLLQAPQLRRVDFAEADHTFSESRHWAAACAQTLEWLRSDVQSP